MEKFHLLARLNHRITDVVTLTVEAENQSDAFAKAKRALSTFPVTEVEGIPYCYIEHRYFNETEVAHIEDMEEDDGA